MDTAIMFLCLGLLCAYMFLIPRPLQAEGAVDQIRPVEQSPAVESPPPEAGANIGITQPGLLPQPTALPQAQVPENSGAANTASSSSGWFPEKYTSQGVVQTETGYQSPNVNVSIQKVQESGITYYVADIYVRNLDYLRTYFANDTYGSGYRQNVKDMAQATNAILAISGDYYGNQSRGVVIRNGEVYRKSVNGDVCVLYNDGVMETYDQAAFSTDQAISRGAYQAWSFGPKLLRDGQPMTEFNTSVGVANPRAAIGYYEPGHFCLVVVDGRQPGYSDGMTMAELSKMFYDLGCKDAYNLDGGQTAQMVYEGATVNQPYHGGRSVSDIIYIGE
jgi:exopolysaccharide biosynthesis protein